jgi:hypothetical protein
MGVAVMRKNKWMDVIVQLTRYRKNQRMNSKIIITFCQLVFTGLVSFLTWHFSDDFKFSITIGLFL